jgi:hypothetical protein
MPSPGWEPVWAWGLGLGLIVLMAVALQGPRRALGQVLDVRAHVALLGGSLGRVRGAGRFVAVLMGSAVLAWSGYQLGRYASEMRADDLRVFRLGRSAGESAIEQGWLAALVPLRDLGSLGDNLPLLLLAAIVLFGWADRWVKDEPIDLTGALADRGWPRGTMVCWAVAWLSLVYRVGSVLGGDAGLPLGGCVGVEALVVPLLIAGSDGILLAWSLVELRAARTGGDARPLDARSAVRAWPGAILACVAMLPGRYLAYALWLALPYAPSGVAQAVIAPVLRGWGLVWAQGVGLVALGLAGAAAWGGGSMRGTLRAWVRLMRAEGGHLAGAVALGSATVGVAVGLVYAVVLSLPRQGWVLLAADGYAHYLSLGAGLILLSALVELGARSLPRATLAETEDSEPVTTAEIAG